MYIDDMGFKMLFSNCFNLRESIVFISDFIGLYLHLNYLPSIKVGLLFKDDNNIKVRVKYNDIVLKIRLINNLLNEDIIIDDCDYVIVFNTNEILAIKYSLCIKKKVIHIDYINVCKCLSNDDIISKDIKYFINCLFSIDKSSKNNLLDYKYKINNYLSKIIKER